MKGSNEEQNNFSQSPPPPPYSPPEQQQEHLSKKDHGSFASGPPPPGLHAPQQSVYTQQPTVVVYPAPLFFGPDPIPITCPNCHQNVLTETHSASGNLTCMLTTLCCCLGCGICSFIPCCVRECKDIEHSCPNCEYKLGIFQRVR